MSHVEQPGVDYRDVLEVFLLVYWIDTCFLMTHPTTSSNTLQPDCGGNSLHTDFPQSESVFAWSPAFFSITYGLICQNSIYWRWGVRLFKFPAEMLRWSVYPVMWKWLVSIALRSFFWGTCGGNYLPLLDVGVVLTLFTLRPRWCLMAAVDNSSKHWLLALPSTPSNH